MMERGIPMCLVSCTDVLNKREQFHFQQKTSNKFIE